MVKTLLSVDGIFLIATFSVGLPLVDSPRFTLPTLLFIFGSFIKFLLQSILLSLCRSTSIAAPFIEIFLNYCMYLYYYIYLLNLLICTLYLYTIFILYYYIAFTYYIYIYCTHIAYKYTNSKKK
jgi:hypothetical protein